MKHNEYTQVMEHGPISLVMLLVSVVPSTLKKSTGLIVDNYKPKLMELPSLTTDKFGKLHRRLAKAKNMRQKLRIKGKNEKWHFN
jgi:hypothetical protein